MGELRGMWARSEKGVFIVPERTKSGNDSHLSFALPLVIHAKTLKLSL